MAIACTHLEEIRDVQPRTDGCEECLRSDGHWIKLRMCLTCGHVGCCDSSPSQHAWQHFHDTHHPVMRSAEPGEQWGWCYLEEKMLVPEDLQPTPPAISL
jgi:hypothetical protein